MKKLIIAAGLAAAVLDADRDARGRRRRELLPGQGE